MSTLMSGNWTVGLVVTAVALTAGCARFHDPAHHHAASNKSAATARKAPTHRAKPAKDRADLKRSSAPPATIPTPAPAGERKASGIPEKPAPSPSQAAAATSPAPPLVSAIPAPQPSNPPEVRPTDVLRSTTPPPPVPVPEQRSISQELLDVGRKLFADGNVMDARRRFIAAMGGAAPEATWALAQSFDPHYLARLPANDATADPERAQSLYRTAIERGLKGAQSDLDRITSALEKPKQ